ncbi:MAG: hypothetical protein AAGM67_01730, partial [Bacteroidota bacterium]
MGSFSNVTRQEPLQSECPHFLSNPQSRDTPIKEGGKIIVVPLEQLGCIIQYWKSDTKSASVCQLFCGDALVLPDSSPFCVGPKSGFDLRLLFHLRNETTEKVVIQTNPALHLEDQPITFSEDNFLRETRCAPNARKDSCTCSTMCFTR